MTLATLMRPCSAACTLFCGGACVRCGCCLRVPAAEDELQQQTFGKQTAVQNAEQAFASERNRMASEARRLQSHIASLEEELKRYHATAASAL